MNPKPILFLSCFAAVTLAAWCHCRSTWWRGRGGGAHFSLDASPRWTELQRNGAWSASAGAAKLARRQLGGNWNHHHHNNSNRRFVGDSASVLGLGVTRGYGYGGYPTATAMDMAPHTLRGHDYNYNGIYGGAGYG
jgi:hypothetical protein